MLDGFSAVGTQRSFYVTDGSSDITINGGFGDDQSGSTASIEVDGTTSDIIVSRMAVEARNPIEVDPGASGVVITGNSIQPDATNSWGVLVNGAPGTDVTGNTIQAICSGGIAVEGASTGVTVENNIVQPAGGACGPGGTGIGTGTGISVSGDSETGSVVDYNLIDPTDGGPRSTGAVPATPASPLSRRPPTRARTTSWPSLTWGTKTYEPSPPPPLASADVFWFPLEAGSPAIDSADSNAPGALPTDQFGDPRTDDPSVPNTGVGYYDRGAVELEGGTATAPTASAASTGSLTATWTLRYTPAWPTNGPLTTTEVSFGDDAPAEVGYATSIPHTYSTAGLYTVDDGLAAHTERRGCRGGGLHAGLARPHPGHARRHRHRQDRPGRRQGQADAIDPDCRWRPGR